MAKSADIRCPTDGKVPCSVSCTGHEINTLAHRWGGRKSARSQPQNTCHGVNIDAKQSGVASSLSVTCKGTGDHLCKAMTIDVTPASGLVNAASVDVSCTGGGTV